MAFLYETKSSSSFVLSLNFKLGFEKFYSVGAKGRSWGLCLLWNDNTNLNVLSSSENHIDSEIGGIGHTYHWQFTGFYDNPVMAKRIYSWNLLRSLTSSSSIPWVVGGDFNELLSVGEKESGPIRLINQTPEFREMVGNYNLRDLGFSGNQFTWLTTRLRGIRECLDRVLVTLDWKALFANATVFHLDPSKSDHILIILFMDGSSAYRRKCRYGFS